MLEKEYQEQRSYPPIPQEREREFQNMIETAKVKVNELLFEIFPPEATIGDLDDLAGFVYQKAFDLWEHHRKD